MTTARDRHSANMLEQRNEEVQASYTKARSDQKKTGSLQISVNMIDYYFEPRS